MVSKLALLLVLGVAYVSRGSAAGTCSIDRRYTNSGACVDKPTCDSYNGTFVSSTQNSVVAGPGCQFSSTVGCCTRLGPLGTPSPICNNGILSPTFQTFVCGAGATLIGSVLTAIFGNITIPLGPCSAVCRAYTCALRGLYCPGYEALQHQVGAGCPQKGNLDCQEEINLPESVCQMMSALLYYGIDTRNLGQFWAQVPSGADGCTSNCLTPQNDPPALNATQLFSLSNGIDANLLSKLLVSCVYVDASTQLLLNAFLSLLSSSNASAASSFINGSSSVVGPCSDVCQAGVCATAVLGCKQSVAMIKTNVQVTNSVSPPLCSEIPCKSYIYDAFLACNQLTACPFVMPCASGLPPYRVASPREGNLTELCCNICPPPGSTSSTLPPGQTTTTPAATTSGSFLNMITAPAPGGVPYWVWIIVGVVGCILVTFFIILVVVLLTRRRGPQTVIVRSNSVSKGMKNSRRHSQGTLKYETQAGDHTSNRAGRSRSGSRYGTTGRDAPTRREGSGTAAPLNTQDGYGKLPYGTVNNVGQYGGSSGGHTAAPSPGYPTVPSGAVTYGNLNQGREGTQFIR